MKYILILISALFVFTIFTGDSYGQCMSDADCDNAMFCDGVELCVSSSCTSGTDACLPGEVCDEVADICVSSCHDNDGDGSADSACGGTDCDDSDSDRFPGNHEVCDAEDHDEDCDPMTFGERDADGDGFFDATCCNDDGVGGTNCGNDCDDSRASTHPIAIDVCNGLDDDCDGNTDDETTVSQYVDSDMDGYGDHNSLPEFICPDTAGYSPLDNDCDDTNPAIIPGTFICNPNENGQGGPFANNGVLKCNSEGIFEPSVCPAATSVCVTQPNSTGVCQVQNINR